ncbi:MAG TPA: response regulator [Candidatus Saccharimonadales bacterium]|nr:response regulator [Candidatus Saccharimonadales bacterium]
MKKQFSVLIIEDEEALAKALKQRFEADGFLATVALDGVEAIPLIESNSFDLIILDILMPNLDGWDVLESVRDKNKLVLVLSNLSQPEDIRRAKSLGAKDYLVKSHVSLTKVVSKAISLLNGKDDEEH